jgi:hypothetical protein
MQPREWSNLFGALAYSHFSARAITAYRARRGYADLLDGG